MKTITIKNKQQRLFVFDSGKYITCLGYDVVINRIEKLTKELKQPEKVFKSGTFKSLHEYNRLTKLVMQMNKQTKFQSKSELTPEFIGKEGRKVEIIDKYGEKRRFIIGKSTGWIPCHLEIKRCDSMGGGCITGYPFKSYKFID